MGKKNRCLRYRRCLCVRGDCVPFSSIFREIKSLGKQILDYLHLLEFLNVVQWHGLKLIHQFVFLGIVKINHVCFVCYPYQQCTNLPYLKKIKDVDQKESRQRSSEINESMTPSNQKKVTNSTNILEERNLETWFFKRKKSPGLRKPFFLLLVVAKKSLSKYNMLSNRK